MTEGDIASFRDDVRHWLERNLPLAGPWGPVSTAEGLAGRRAWERRLYDAGYAVLGWPREWGGAGAGPEWEAAFQEEYLASGAPERLNKVALGMAAPTLLRHGTTEQKQRWLPGIARCDAIWCQGFSEPEAGSDLGALRARGRVDGDSLVISGQKTWSTYGGIADWMFALVRTGPELDPRHSITFVMIPMRAEGVEVRPIRQLHGAPDFADVFLKDVRVPLDHVIGEIDNGWAVARSTLRHERGAGLASHVALAKDAATLAATAKRAGVGHRADIRSQVATAHVTSRAFSAYVGTCRAHPEVDRSSVIKLAWSETRTAINEAILDCVADGPVELRFDLERTYWHGRAAEIYGGSNEIQRNIIARRILLLPAGEVTR